MATSKSEIRDLRKSPRSHMKMKTARQTSEVLLDCIRRGDIDSFRGVLSEHISKSNKLRFARRAGLGRQTLYDILDPSKGFNPALSTVTAIMRGLAE